MCVCVCVCVCADNCRSHGSYPVVCTKLWDAFTSSNDWVASQAGACGSKKVPMFEAVKYRDNWSRRHVVRFIVSSGICSVIHTQVVYVYTDAHLQTCKMFSHARTRTCTHAHTRTQVDPDRDSTLPTTTLLVSSATHP